MQLLMVVPAMKHQLRACCKRLHHRIHILTPHLCEPCFGQHLAHRHHQVAVGEGLVGRGGVVLREGEAGRGKVEGVG